MTDWPIVGLTAALVLITGYYAWQNKRMVDALRRQTRPYVFLEFGWDLRFERSRYQLLVRNAGDRSAAEIVISVKQDAQVSASPPAAAVLHTPAFSGDPAPISSVVARPIRWLLPSEDRELGFVATAANASHQKQTLVYRVTYTDGAGLRYEENDVVLECLAPLKRRPR